MSDYKLVPVEPTPEMVEAAEDAYMPFGDMEMAIRMALLSAPAVQGESVYLYRRRGLHDFATCNRDRYAELSVKPHLFETKVLYTTPQPAEQQSEVLAEGYFHPLPDENDYEFHDAEQFPDGSNCPACVPAVIVRRSAVENQLAPDVPGLTEALRQYRHNDGSGLVFGYDRLLVDQYVAGLAQQHHRDSAELRRLCQARDEQRDGRLAALERAAKAEAGVAQLVEALETCLEIEERPKIIKLARAALAAHRKQGGEA